MKSGQGIGAEVRPAKALAVFNVDRIVHAIDNTCTHRGGPTWRGKSRRVGRDLPLARLAIQCD
ncbi:MAG: Rieske 2Fe-2S domain-containing protein [Nitrospirota bacterium]